MAKHQKHAKIERKFNDISAPNEISILGAKCSIIADLVTIASEKLSDYNLAYFDASHAKDVEQHKLTTYTFHHKGNLETTTTSVINKFEQRLQFYNHDFVFINGNHYEGAKQVVILDEAKEASIIKRLDQITSLQFIVKLKAETEIFDCLKEKFPHIESIPVYTINEVDKIVNHFNQLIQEHIAPVRGLVLTGGKSTRMGKNKSELSYHGIPQKEYTKNLIGEFLGETFYSVRDKSENHNEIHDTFVGLGPFGGICSAFQKDPNSAWSVLATDLPFVNKDLIELLLKKRNPSKVATAIKGKDKQFPEPLITIYEPKAYGKLLQYLAQGYSCPRKMLINADVEIVEVDDALIRNVNTPEDYNQAKKELNS